MHVLDGLKFSVLSVGDLASVIHSDKSNNDDEHDNLKPNIEAVILSRYAHLVSSPSILTM